MRYMEKYYLDFSKNILKSQYTIIELLFLQQFWFPVPYENYATSERNDPQYEMVSFADLGIGEII